MTLICTLFLCSIKERRRFAATFFFAKEQFSSAAKMHGYENIYTSDYSNVENFDDTNERFAQIKKDIKEYEEGFRDMINMIKAIVKNVVDEEVANEKEALLRDMKRKQIICIGVKESRNAVTEEERCKNDRRLVEKIMFTIGCGNKINEIKMMRRVGDVDNNKDRILCIAFYDEATRDNVLRFSNKLKDSNLRNVWLHKDLTNTQMQVLKAKKKVKTSRKCG